MSPRRSHDPLARLGDEQERSRVVDRALVGQPDLLLHRRTGREDPPGFLLLVQLSPQVHERIEIRRLRRSDGELISEGDTVLGGAVGVSHLCSRR